MKSNFFPIHVDWFDATTALSLSALKKLYDYLYVLLKYFSRYLDLY